MRIQKYALAIVIFLLCCASAAAQTAFSGDFEYRNNTNGTVTITKWKGSNLDVVIPSVIGGLPVKEIGQSAFEHCGLTSITMPSSITTIGKDALKDNQLTTLTLPDSVVSIGERAFYGNSLTRLKLPANISTVVKNAFGGNSVTAIEVLKRFSLKEDLSGLPQYFTVYYNLHGRKAGTYTLQDDTWLLNGNAPPPHGSIRLSEGAILIWLDGDEADNYSSSQSTWLYLLPAGKHELGLKFQRSDMRQADAGSVNLRNITVRGGKEYQVTGFVKGDTYGFTITEK